MSPPSALLGLLRCINCSSELESSELEELRCPSCASVYAVRHSTPRMVVPSLDPADERTAASFAYEWRRFGALRPEWARNFADYLAPLAPVELRGKLLLDVGAGSGRHSFHAHAAGAHVVAVDAGESIDVARENLPAEVMTVQADARLLPFAPQTFDFVFCIGMLHHLRDPAAALRQIVSLTKPGGRVHIYVYWQPEQQWHQVLLRGVSAARKVTTRMPHRVLHLLCFPIALGLSAVFVAPYRLARHSRWRFAARFPLKAYADYPFAVLVNDQFDRFSAPIERRYTRREVAQMMREAGLEDVVVVENHGWVADGCRPGEPVRAPGEQ